MFTISKSTISSLEKDLPSAAAVETVWLEGVISA
jgi:hypothetical protein